MSPGEGVGMTFSKRMMFLTSLLLALFASALWVSCDLGTNGNGDDGDVSLSRNGSVVRPTVTSELGTYVGKLTVQMDVPIVFTITLVLKEDGSYVYTSESERGNVRVEGAYVLKSDGTLILYRSDGSILGTYAYDDSVSPTTIFGDWYIGDAPDPVYRPTTLDKVVTLGSFIQK